MRPQVARKVRKRPGLKAALLLDIAPRKVGSFEELIVAICKEAVARGHSLDVWTWDPVHDAVRAGVEDSGASLRKLDDLWDGGASALRRYDLLQLHHFGLRSPLAMRAYAALPAKVQFVDRSSDARATGKRPLHRRLAGSILDRLISARLNGVAAVSEWVCVRDKERFGKDVVTLLNGVNLDRFRPRARLVRDRPAVLCVAHLIPEKGVDVLLNAVSIMRQRPDLVIVGDGPDLPHLEQRVRDRGLEDRVHFLGLRSDVPERLVETDVFVHPAVWHEAFGFTVAEAMACAVPVVATAVGGIPEVVAEGQTGLLVPPGDEAALAGALDRLLEDPELRRRMGAAGRKRAEALFDVRRCALGYVDFLESAR